jgi:ADP-ribose 1''-phosphate phosphatase
MLKYKKGSLFDAPEDTLLVHACNAKGVWGSGIALEFKKQYPRAFETYYWYCLNRPNVIGTAHMTNGVGCLITSSGYASGLDSKNEILVNTTLALNDLCKQGYKKIASPLFNSGLFKVPWADTEQILSVFVKKYKLDWTVYEV